MLTEEDFKRADAKEGEGGRSNQGKSEPSKSSNSAIWWVGGFFLLAILAQSTRNSDNHYHAPEPSTDGRIRYTNTAPVGQWQLINPLTGYSYKIIDGGRKYFVQDGDNGPIYYGGPGGTSFSLNSNRVFIQSRENYPVNLVFEYTKN